MNNLTSELQKLDAALKKSEAENQDLKQKLDEAIKAAATAGQAQPAAAPAAGDSQAVKELESARAEIKRLLEANKALQAEVEKTKAQVANLTKQLTDQTNHFQEAQMVMAKGINAEQRGLMRSFCFSFKQVPFNLQQT